VEIRQPRWRCASSVATPIGIVQQGVNPLLRRLGRLLYLSLRHHGFAKSDSHVILSHNALHCTPPPSTCVKSVAMSGRTMASVSQQARMKRCTKALKQERKRRGSDRWKVLGWAGSRSCTDTASACFAKRAHISLPSR
jgi:hypothetical protein